MVRGMAVQSRCMHGAFVRVRRLCDKAGDLHITVVQRDAKHKANTQIYTYVRTIQWPLHLFLAAT